MTGESLVAALDLKTIRTKPYTPQTTARPNGFIKTISVGWAYGIALPNIGMNATAG